MLKKRKKVNSNRISALTLDKAFGVEVTVFSTSPAKKQEALEVLEADNFTNSIDDKQMEVRVS